MNGGRFGFHPPKVVAMSTTSSTVNYWPDSKCAKAFWGQNLLPPYRQLLKHTARWLQPKPGDRWLDLGCGAGRLSEMLWQLSNGTVTEVVGLDCADVNERAFAKLRETLQPTPTIENLHFVAADFSHGLAAWPAEHFNGIVSGLAIQYAESYAEQEQRWTTDAYNRILAEAHRLLQPGGRFVFSVNVPEPSWGKVAVKSFAGAFRERNPIKYLQKSFRMWRYGGWLKREARKGRFHYLTATNIEERLRAVGFVDVEHRLSFAGQAYLFRATKAA